MTLPLLTIGIPVYNSEKIIKKRLENILSQSFQDFNLIIYDNSTDSTPILCKEFASRNKRITYIHEIKKNGIEFAFNYLLQKANTKYFVWAADDDVWDSYFLEKNMNILETQDDIVGSIGQVKKYNLLTEDFLLTPTDSFFKKNYKKIRKRFRHFGHVSIYANSHEKRAGKFLRTNEELSIYAIFRTKELQVSQAIIINDKNKKWAIGINPYKKTILNILKYGNFNVLNEVLWWWSSEHYVSTNVILQYKDGSFPLKGLLFPYYEYSFWCMKNLGIKFFLKNIDYFIISDLFYRLITAYNFIYSLLNISTKNRICSDLNTN